MTIDILSKVFYAGDGKGDIQWNSRRASRSSWMPPHAGKRAPSCCPAAAGRDCARAGSKEGSGSSTRGSPSAPSGSCCRGGATSSRSPATAAASLPTSTRAFRFTASPSCSAAERPSARRSPRRRTASLPRRTRGASARCLKIAAVFPAWCCATSRPLWSGRCRPASAAGSRADTRRCSSTSTSGSGRRRRRYPSGSTGASSPSCWG